jgi:hypothetical protein
MRMSDFCCILRLQGGASCIVVGLFGGLCKRTQENLTPVCPVRKAAGSEAVGGHSLSIANISLQWERIQDRAYLSIGVTSPSGPGLCGVPGAGDSRGIGAPLCTMLHTNFREYLFHALR